MILAGVEGLNKFHDIDGSHQDPTKKLYFGTRVRNHNVAGSNGDKAVMILP
jgi:hypothetical protein